MLLTIPDDRIKDLFYSDKTVVIKTIVKGKIDILFSISYVI
jgi:hypothetical protein